MHPERLVARFCEYSFTVIGKYYTCIYYVLVRTYSYFYIRSKNKTINRKTVLYNPPDIIESVPAS